MSYAGCEMRFNDEDGQEEKRKEEPLAEQEDESLPAAILMPMMEMFAVVCPFSGLSSLVSSMISLSISVSFSYFSCPSSLTEKQTGVVLTDDGWGGRMKRLCFCISICRSSVFLSMSVSRFPVFLMASSLIRISLSFFMKHSCCQW